MFQQLAKFTARPAGACRGMRTFATFSMSPIKKKPASEPQEHHEDIDQPIPNISAAADLYSKVFLNDVQVNSQLQKLVQLQKRNPQHVKVGILYDNEETASTSKVIESLLADPLASDNKTWFENINKRSRKANNMFVFYDRNSQTSQLPAESVANTFSVPSPLLSADSTVIYKEAAAKSVQLSDFHKFNPIQIIEINNLAALVNPHTTCHYFIHITNNFNSTIDKYPQNMRDNILLTVVDNIEYTPSSQESSVLEFTQLKHHVMKIDSRKSFKGISEFLENDTKAASLYVESIKNSNIFALCKFMYLFLNCDILGAWMKQNITDQILRSIQTELNQSLYDTIEQKDIHEFSNEIHSELQNVFIPETTQFFNKKLRWYKLYLKNDNIEYDIKDFFNKNFMNQSIERYNFYRGQIVSKLTRGQKKAHDVHNPLLQAKNEVFAKIELEVQPVVYISLIEGFTFYQLPISVISFFAWKYFGFQLEGVLALASLGWVLGFNHVSKRWERFTNKWLQELFEDIRVKLGKDCIENGLMRELTFSYELQAKLNHVKNRIVKVLENERV